MYNMATVSQLKDSYIREYGMYLAAEGKSLIEAAYYGRDFNNRSYNLHDSYGSCVFFNGKEILGTRRYIGKVATNGHRNSEGTGIIMGREEVDKYFDTYRSSFKGFELVTAVAMFYGKYLENGSGRLKRKYKVISGMDSKLAELASKLNGKIVNINI